MRGWQRTHRMPARIDTASQTYLAELAADELTQDLDDVFRSLKRAFTFKRRDVEARDPIGGAGLIITPYFNYSVCVELNPDDLREVIWTRTVDAIVQPERLSAPEADSVFGNTFDTIEYTFKEEVDLEAFIDAVELAELPGLDIEYDREATYCNLALPGATGDLQVTPQTLSIVHQQKTPASTLLQSFETVRLFAFENGIPLLPVAAPVEK